MTPANYISVAALIISLIMMIYNITNGNKNQDRAEEQENDKTSSAPAQSRRELQVCS